MSVQGCARWEEHFLGTDKHWIAESHSGTLAKTCENPCLSRRSWFLSKVHVVVRLMFNLKFGGVVVVFFSIGEHAQWGRFRKMI